ncbi:response regulator [Isosphaeraceae bacterium EP7]
MTGLPDETDEPREAAAGSRILIVDDSPTNRLHLELLAGRMGHATAAVADGRAALEQAASSPPDLIVLDLSLDDPGPIEVIEALQRDPATAEIPLIVVANPDDLATLAEALHHPGTLALSRPFCAASLAGRISAAREAARPMTSRAQPRGDGHSQGSILQLLSHLGHDLRSPLNAVQGYSQLVRDELRDMGHEDLADDLVKVLDGGKRMLAMIDDLTDLARVEIGSIRFERRAFAFRTLLESDLERLTRAAGGRGVELSGRWVCDGPAEFIGDAGRMRQIVLGLLNAALSATQSGRIEVSAECLGGGPTWEVSVEAPSFGVAPAELARLLAGDDWAGSDAVQSEGGRVLPLILSRRLAEGLGGRFAVEPREDGATRAVLRVDSAAEPSAESPCAEPAACPAPEEIPDLPPLSILLAEDSPVNQGLVRLFLGRLGQSADVASNGLEVMEAVSKNAYDVILMDVQMPELDGLSASRRLRAELPEDRQPWIIGLTAMAPPEGRQECLDAGMDDYLPKPIQLSQLAAALARQTPRVAIAIAPF